MKSRLRKKIIAEGDPTSSPLGIVIPNYQDTLVDKDKILDKTYGPSISRKWLSNEPIDNPEWALRQSLRKKT